MGTVEDPARTVAPTAAPGGRGGRRGGRGRDALATLRRLLQPLFAEPALAERLGARGVGARGVGAAGLWRVAAAFAVLAAGTAVGLLRQPGAGALDTVWAEDGSVFLSGADGRSFWDALTASYAGYLHLGPRLLAEVAALFPVGWAAAVLAVEAALVTSALALVVYAAAQAHLPSPLLRAVVAAPVVVLPLAQEELPNAIANLHWPALYATFWVLVWNPAGRGARAVAATVAGLTAASDLLCVVFLPLAVGRALTVRGWRGRLVPLALAAGLVLQVAVRLFGETSRSLTPNPNPVWAGAAYVLRTVPLALVGERWLGADVDSSPGYLGLVAVAWLLVLAAVVLALRRLTRPAWTLAVVAAVHSAGLYVVSAMLSGLVVPRYSAAPALLLIAALAALLRGGPGVRASWAPAALAGLLLVVCAVNLRVHNPRADGPRWQDSVRGAEVACRDTARAPAAVDLPISPAGWAARLPCSAGLD